MKSQANEAQLLNILSSLAPDQDLINLLDSDPSLVNATIGGKAVLSIAISTGRSSHIKILFEKGARLDFFPIEADAVPICVARSLDEESILRFLCHVDIPLIPRSKLDFVHLSSLPKF